LLLEIRFAFAIFFAAILSYQIPSTHSDEVISNVQTVEPASVFVLRSDNLNPDDPKAASEFQGRVTDSSGSPIFQAKIYVLALGEPNSSESKDDRKKQVACPIRALTDVDGRFLFIAEDFTDAALDGLPTRRNCIVVAKADGYTADWIELRGRNGVEDCETVDKGSGLQLELTKDSAPFQGQFLLASGTPLRGAKVRLLSLMIPTDRNLEAHLKQERKAWNPSGTIYAKVLGQFDSILEIQNEAMTDSEGRFRLSGMGLERIARLEVTSPEIFGTWISVITREGDNVPVCHGETLYASGFTMTTSPGLRVAGVVRDAETNQPLPGMLVGIGNGYPRDALRSSRETTDENGRFEITGVHPSIRDQGGKPILVTAVSSPGNIYQSASVAWTDNDLLVIKCSKGIPFRVKVIDESGTPVLAKVTYVDAVPNPNTLNCNTSTRPMPMNLAAIHDDGTYRGFVIPGPGAIFIRAVEDSLYQPAYADPKAFFVTGELDSMLKADWQAFGNIDDVYTSMGQFPQNNFSAIELVNPHPGEKRLELTVKLRFSKPRMVSLVDDQGSPVVAVNSNWMAFRSRNVEPPMRSATFPITGLHPIRGRRITFFDEERRLVGFLVARSDAETPYTVAMKSWSSITGRVVDEHGNACKVLLVSPAFSIRSHSDSQVGLFTDVKTDVDGSFLIDRLVPGKSYTALIRRNGATDIIGRAFESLELEPGENRDLGTIRIGKQVAMHIDAPCRLSAYAIAIFNAE
jgi:hypothetical protein